jgi:hypothetical protein
MSDLAFQMPAAAPVQGEWDGADTIVFDSYPPKGWIGVCSYEYCNSETNGQETPSAIVPGYSYNIYSNYFVFYLTQDLFSGDIGDPSDPDFDYEGMLEMIDSDFEAWIESYFGWLFVEESDVVQADASYIEGFLSAIGVTVGEGAPEMTVTMIWSAEVDLDLYYSCSPE